MAGLGCFATAAQVAYIREFLIVFAGNELCLGVILGCWFAGIAGGALVGGRLSRWVRHPAAWLVGCAVFMFLLLPGLIALLRLWRGIAGVGPGEVPGLGVLAVCGLLLITPLASLIGLIFPLVCRLASVGDDSRAIGRAYVFESIGSVVGGAAVGMVLAGQVTTLESIVITGLPLLSGLAWFGIRGPRRSARIMALFTSGLFAIFATVLIFGGARRLDTLLTLERFEQLGGGGQRAGWADTPYQYLDLGRSGAQYTLFADGKVTRTFPDPYRSRPRSHLVMCEHPDPRRVLVLGTATFEFLPSAIVYPIERIDMVEIDPAVNALVEVGFDQRIRKALSDPRLHVHLTDGRRFLRRTGQKWDVIFADVPDPTTAARNRFYTRGFFELARSRLAPGGVFVTRLSSSENYLGRESASLVRSIKATLAKVFGQVDVIPGQESFFVASDKPGFILTDPDKLGDRYQARGIDDPGFTRYHFKVLFQSGLVLDLQQQIKERGAAFINTDARPVSYLQSISRWAHLMGETSVSWLGRALALPAWVWYLAALLLAAPFTGSLFLVRAKNSVKQRRAAGLALFVVGAYGMTIELVLTFAYQSMLGSLYREMGLIVASFMAGLALGSFIVERRLANISNSAGTLSLTLFIQAAFAAAVPLLVAPQLLSAMPLWAEQLYILALILAAGFGAGMAFPLAGHVAVTSGRELGPAAGALDAADHLGAVAGSLLAGVLLIPVLGRLHACLLLAVIMAIAGLANFVLARRSE